MLIVAQIIEVEDMMLPYTMQELKDMNLPVSDDECIMVEFDEIEFNAIDSEHLVSHLVINVEAYLEAFSQIYAGAEYDPELNLTDEEEEFYTDVYDFMNALVDEGLVDKNGYVRLNADL